MVVCHSSTNAIYTHYTGPRIQREGQVDTDDHNKLKYEKDWRE